MIIAATINSDGTKVSVPIPQGTGVVLHVPGLHYNREHLASNVSLEIQRRFSVSSILGGPLRL